MIKITDFLKKLLTYERSPHKLALSFCIGNYIAFSPFLFFHTAMIFVFSWVLRLNFAVTFATAYFINNPATMMFVYGADYSLGYWLLYKLAGIDAAMMNPSWVTSLSQLFQQKIGYSLPCLWSFFIGGNLLGIVSSAMLYPIMKRLFSKMARQPVATPPVSSIP